MCTQGGLEQETSVNFHEISVKLGHGSKFEGLRCHSHCSHHLSKPNGLHFSFNQNFTFMLSQLQSYTFTKSLETTSYKLFIHIVGWKCFLDLVFIISVYMI